eukprot:PhF_6_TR11585/c1_g1_i2/m.18743
MSGPAKRPQMLVCYMCGQQFGTASLGIHMPQCYEKKMAEWKNADPKTRGPKPNHPDTVDLSHVPKSVKDVDAVSEFNEAQFKDYKENMSQCPNCGRKFLPDRLEVHLRSCKGNTGPPKSSSTGSTAPSGPAKRPQMLVCYMCG